LGPDGPKRGQDGPNRTTCSEVVKSSNRLRPEIASVFAMFLGSKSIQDSLGMPKKAPERHLESFGQLKKESQDGSDFLQVVESIVGSFGVTLGSATCILLSDKGDMLFLRRYIQHHGDQDLEPSLWVKPAQRTLWENIMGKHYGETLWGDIMGKHYGETLWGNIMGEHYGRTLWETLRAFSRAVNLNIMEKHYGPHVVSLPIP
jgi:hypothetical protein